MTRKNVYQFKIALLHIDPPIWRRIQVPEAYAFWDLHVVIQNTMGWLDCHLHTFRFIDLEANEQTEIRIAGEFDEIVLPVIGHNRTKFEAAHNRIANLNQA